MIRILGALLLAAQVVSTGPARWKPAASSSCNPPTMTYRWAAYTGDLCGSSPGSACSNGQSLYSVTDAVAGNVASAVATTYTTAVFSGQPAWTLSGSNSALQMATGIPASTSTWTMYAVVKPTDTATRTITGGESGALEWRLNSGQQQMLVQQQAYIGGGSGTCSAGSACGLAVTWNTGTGAYAFYRCSAGTCASDGSGTYSGTALSQTTSYIGGAPSASEWFSGQIAEFGFLNGISTAGIGAWMSCKYGI